MSNNYIRFNVANSFKHIDCMLHAIGYNYNFPELHGNNKSTLNNYRNWRRMDYRLNELFGSTYEIPISDYYTSDAEHRFIVWGDKYLQCPSTTLSIYDIADTRDPLINGGKMSEVSIDTLDMLSDIIAKSYPNSNVYVNGDFDKSSTNMSDIHELHTYLLSLSTPPTHVIFSGLEYTFNKYGKGTTLSCLKNIVKYFTENNVKYIIVLCNPDRPTSEDFYAVKNEISNSNILDIASIAEPMKYDYTRASVYEDYIYNNIYDRCIELLGLDIHRDKYYLSLVDVVVDKNSTYNKFFKSNKYAINSYGKGDIAEYKLEKTTYIGKYNGFNMFKNSGEFLAICLHTGFDIELFANEQFQSTCNYEYTHQRDALGDLVNFLPVRSIRDGREGGRVTAPVYPMTGCSWLTISDGDKEKYINMSKDYTPICVWVTRDDLSVSITTHLFGSELTLNPYQSVEFGCFTIDTYKSHCVPLYCGGGSGALCQDIYVFTPVGGSSKTYVTGNVYDLSMENIAMSNSNLAYITKFNGSAVSNFKILSPEGVWKNIFSAEQGSTVIPYPTSGSPTPDFAYVLKPIQYSNSGNSYTPCMGKSIRKVALKYADKHKDTYVYGNDEYKIDTYRYDMSLRGISVVLDKVTNKELFSIGTIPDCFISWGTDFPCGETTINGDKYLCIPNGWNGRLYDYGHHYGIFNDEWETDVIVDNWETKSLLHKDNIIKDRLVIRLGGD